MSILLSILFGLLVNECCELSPWIARRVVRWAAYRRYRNPVRARIRAEELAGVIDARPGKLFKLMTALAFGAVAAAVWISRNALCRAPKQVQRLVHKHMPQLSDGPSVLSAGVHALYPPTAESVAGALRLVDEVCVSLNENGLRHLARLVASELVANAVEHAGGEIGFSVDCDGSSLKISVRDESSAPPRAHRVSEGLRGRGLRVVQAAAAECGWTLEPGGGKTVWATIPLTLRS
ncbi:ATP-binding protein [Pseudosporangium ferrugineum]|uniref:Histidine kinase/HSP90-like ATPase domain-containing protein n=1 Tax=Pseudosporangium ferrugineum TaxID=439699 RepID=A0A2T0S9Z8_9ACTN|nr:ATP-binding protein [Pseudosporangium ferrugineum]PRY30249.1 hypothetical protein CLV70_105419 [Pseudosporangium ferrugineum]